MSNLLKSKFLLGVLVVAVLVVGGVAFATPAAADCSITTTLRAGSVGAEVSCLQTIIGATADGKFGPMTKAAVMAWQAGHGLVADGVVGAMTRAALMGAPTGNFPAGCTSASGFSATTGVACNTGASAGLPAGCSSTSGYSPLTGTKCDSSTGGSSTGPLAGNSGEISDINQLSQYSGEEVGSGSEDVTVLGFDVEASNDGDIALKSLKLTFDSNGNNAADSDRITDYLDSLVVLMGSEEVGSADFSDFNKDSTGVYSKSISLSDAIVREGETEKFYVKVNAASNLDSEDINSDSWTVAINSMRVEDGSGVVTSVDSGNSLLTGNMDYDAAGDGVPISFVTFSSAADIELKTSLDTSSPESQVVSVSTTNDTEDVLLLKGKMKLTGDSDVWLDELPITLTSAGTDANSISALASSIKLVIDGKEFTESTGANCIDETDFSGADDCDATASAGVVFDNLDLDIEAGDTINFTVSADLNDVENTGVLATDFDEGDTLLASLTAIGRGAMVVENTEGDSLTDATERTGTATGKAQAFYSKGINVSLVSVSKNRTFTADAAGETDQGDYSIVFDVTAFDDNMYIDASVEDDNGAEVAGQGIVFDITMSGGTATVSSSTLTAAGAETLDQAGGEFWIEEDDTRRFTLNVVLTGDAAADGSYEVLLEQINWADATTAEAAGGVIDADFTNYYTFNLEDFKTGTLYLNDM